MLAPNRPHVSPALTISPLLRPHLPMLTLALLCVIAFATFVWWTSHGVFTSARFDRDGWLARPDVMAETSCYRGGMANDIKSRLLLPGMSADAVVALLGRPDAESVQEYRYVLGMCSGLGFDYDDLHVYFDASGGYSHAAIIQH